MVGHGQRVRVGHVRGDRRSMLGTFGSDLPWNAGLMRPIELHFPENSVVSADPPMPISAGSVAGAWIGSQTAMTC